MTNESNETKLQLKIISLEKKVDHLQSMCVRKDDTIHALELYVEDLEEQLLKDEDVQHPEDAEAECHSSKTAKCHPSEAVDPRDMHIRQSETMNRLIGASLTRAQQELHENAERFKLMAAKIGEEADKRLAELAQENDRLTQENVRLKTNEEQLRNDLTQRLREKYTNLCNLELKYKQATARIADLETNYKHALQTNEQLALSGATARDKLSATGLALEYARLELQQLKDLVNRVFECPFDEINEAYMKLAEACGRPLDSVRRVDYTMLNFIMRVLPLGCTLEVCVGLVDGNPFRVQGNSPSSKLSISHEFHNGKGTYYQYDLTFSPSTGFEWSHKQSRGGFTSRG